MKFGKLIASATDERYASFYVSYKLLKKSLAVDADSDGNLFDYFVRQEIARCSAFFVEKTEEIKGVLAALCDEQQHGTTACKHDKDEVSAKAGAAYLELCALQRFAWLNSQCVTKAVKKRNKNFNARAPMDATALLVSSSFAQPGSAFAQLMSQAEALVHGAEDAAALDDDAQQDMRCSDCIVRGRRRGLCRYLRPSDAAEGDGRCPICGKPKHVDLKTDQSLLKRVADMVAARSAPDAPDASRFSGVGLGPRPDSAPPAPLEVVLDLDHTLIMSLPEHSLLLAQQGGALDGLLCWTVAMSHVPFACKVFIRPGLREFLQALHGRAGVSLSIFTAGIEPYASPILDRIEAWAGVRFVRRLYRDSTTSLPHHPTVKDLARLGTDLRRTVLVDDNPMSFSLQPTNGIPALPFVPSLGATDDTFLLRMLLPVLEALAPPSREDVGEGEEKGEGETR